MAYLPTTYLPHWLLLDARTSKHSQPILQDHLHTVTTQILDVTTEILEGGRGFVLLILCRDHKYARKGLAKCEKCLMKQRIENVILD